MSAEARAADVSSFTWPRSAGLSFLLVARQPCPQMPHCRPQTTAALLISSPAIALVDAGTLCNATKSLRAFGPRFRNSPARGGVVLRLLDVARAGAHAWGLRQVALGSAGHRSRQALRCGHRYR